MTRGVLFSSFAVLESQLASPCPANNSLGGRYQNVFALACPECACLTLARHRLQCNAAPCPNRNSRQHIRAEHSCPHSCITDPNRRRARNTEHARHGHYRGIGRHPPSFDHLRRHAGRHCRDGWNTLAPTAITNPNFYAAAAADRRAHVDAQRNIPAETAPTHRNADCVLARRAGRKNLVQKHTQRRLALSSQLVHDERGWHRHSAIGQSGS